MRFIIRIWDLSLEKDEEEEAEFKAKTREQVNAPADLPPQLLFVHQVLFLWTFFPLSTISSLNHGKILVPYLFFEFVDSLRIKAKIKKQ